MKLKIKLESDATFGRGDGMAGLVDEEVEHDASTGLPYIRGRTLKGLLVEECANILYALGSLGQNRIGRLEKAAQFLFGVPGSSAQDGGKLHVGHARLPGELRDAVAADVRHCDLEPTDILESLTAIRRQTAIDESTGAPGEGSLRAMRVVLRDTTFVAPLHFGEEPDNDAQALLSSCVLSLRRGGTGRNRGRGRLTACLMDDMGNDLTTDLFVYFTALVMEARNEGHHLSHNPTGAHPSEGPQWRPQQRCGL